MHLANRTWNPLRGREIERTAMTLRSTIRWTPTNERRMRRQSRGSSEVLPHCSHREQHTRAASQRVVIIRSIQAGQSSFQHGCRSQPETSMITCTTRHAANRLENHAANRLENHAANHSVIHDNLSCCESLSRSCCKPLSRSFSESLSKSCCEPLPIACCESLS